MPPLRLKLCRRIIKITALLAVAAQAQGPPTPKPPEITLERAIELALANNPSLKATRTQIPQSQAQEITAGLRPNPVLSWDSQFVPLPTPSFFSGDTLNNLQQFDMGVAYLLERGNKRRRRVDAARSQTAVTRSQVADAERTLTFNVALQFINALLAKSNLQFALENLKSFQRTVNLSQERYQAGDISRADLLRIKLQTLQFQTDVTSAEIARTQALGTLRQLIGYDSVDRSYDVAGDLYYEPLTSKRMDLEELALRERPDLQAARQSVTAAQSQIALARANAKQDLNITSLFSHVNAVSSNSFFFTLPLPIFNRNQGEIARTRYAFDQSEHAAKAAGETVLTDVHNAYEAARTNEEVVKLYQSGYLKQAQDSRDISEFAYRQGAATLLDLLDAERSYRATQLAYRQALAAYMLSLEQLRGAVASRTLP